jgi:hypothetical protein
VDSCLLNAAGTGSVDKQSEKLRDLSGAPAVSLRPGILISGFAGCAYGEQAGQGKTEEHHG